MGPKPSGRVLVTISGLTCSGKTTLQNLLTSDKTLPLDFVKVKSTTTREKRSTETESDYNFISMGAFLKQQDDAQFINTTEFGGHKYGTLRADMLDALGAGLTLPGVDLTKGRVAIIVVDTNGVVDCAAFCRATNVVHIHINTIANESELLRRASQRYIDDLKSQGNPALSPKEANSASYNRLVHLRDKELADAESNRDLVIKVVKPGNYITVLSDSPFTSDMLTKLVDMIYEMATRRNVVSDEIDRLRVQLAGVSVALNGGTSQSSIARQGDYGWSAPYQEALDLRRDFDFLRGVITWVRRSYPFKLEDPKDQERLDNIFLPNHRKTK